MKVCDPIFFRSVVVLFVPFLASCLPGISTKTLESNLSESQTHNFAYGTVLVDAVESKRTIVVAFTVGGRKYRHLVSQRIDEKYRFFFALPGNVRYGLAAFTDRNDNGRYDPGEPIGVPAEANDHLLLGKDPIANVRIIIERNRTIPAAVGQTLALRGEGDGVAIPLQVGHVTQLDEGQSSANRCEERRAPTPGAADESGVGISFIEPYDPAKIPVVFVNGFGGCPQDWGHFVSQIDRSRFQPWFFYYPSGMRLHDAATVLDEFIAILHKSYRFDSLFVTAHSMGGLVARDFILQNLQRRDGDYIKLFVSISTPWRGHESAELGVKYAPVIVPSWIDMVPGSEFQHALFIQRLPPHVRYFLFFGYRGDGDDGVVSVASQLWPMARKEAERVYGYKESHESILASSDVLATYQRLLLEVADKTGGKVP